jgi:hypothetical protein
MAITFDTKPIAFGDRTLLIGSYASGDVNQAIDLGQLGFVQINAVAHMGDSKTNINVKTAGNICLPNIIRVSTDSPGNINITIAAPADGVANGGGKFMVIGRRGQS